MSDKWKGFFQARKEKRPGVASGHRLVVMPKDWNKKKKTRTQTCCQDERSKISNCNKWS